jgi:uncharacterized protein
METIVVSEASNSTTIADRVAALEWDSLAKSLDTAGFAVAASLLTEDECDRVAGLYDRSECFRKRVVMARHGFGRGEYQYFRYPLPDVVAELRTAVYPALATIANRWNEAMNIETRFPARHADYLQLCHTAGQKEPTPLLLRYEEGDYNCLHQDLYGDLVFPFQMAFLLSQTEKEFAGGEFVLVEQRPRMQSRAEVVPLRKGDAVIFPVHHRPVRGTRGWYRVNMRHGVSRVRSGQRHTMGIIFHDART